MSSSPTPTRSPPPLSNNEPRIHPDTNHPDSPLPIEPYRDGPLQEYEPQPIAADADDDEDALAAASRPRGAWLAKARVFWLRNKGMFLVLLAQMFGASMNVMTQILEIHSSMHPFQVCLPSSF